MTGFVDRLREAGVDVDAMRDDAKQAVDSATPYGWEAVMVRSRWPEDRCPSCGVGLDVGNLAIAALTRQLHHPQVLLFTLTAVCDVCVQRAGRLGALAATTFR